MRGLAYGVLDPHGERYQLALIHRGECPACRAYVATLRGLAAALPPVPMLARLASLARALAEAPVSPELAPATTPALRPAGGTAAGGSGAGGGWLMGGGSLGAKLAAAGCLVAAGVGAGGLALSGAGNGHGRDAGGPAIARTIAGAAGGGPLALSQELGFETARAGLAALPFASAAPTSPPRRPGAAAREFGLERPRSRRSARSASPSRPAAARPVLGWPAAKPAGAVSGAFAGAGQGSLADRTPRAPSSAAPSAAEREFAPG